MSKENAYEEQINRRFDELLSRISDGDGDGWTLETRSLLYCSEASGVFKGFFASGYVCGRLDENDVWESTGY